MDQKKKLYPSSFNPLLIRPDRGLPKECAIIGAGTIGPDIGYYLKSALDIKLYLIDVAEKALTGAEKRLQGYAKKGVDRGKMSEEKARAILENITYTTDYDQIEKCDMVIEAATESIPLKQKIFRMIEERVSEDCIITSNTSSIPADRIFSEMSRPERTTVTHFFAPAWRSLAVEIINWEKMSREVLDYLFWFFAHTGKAPVITDNVICFMLDRIFDNWCNDAAYLLDKATAAQVCRVVEEFAFQGPFYVLNYGNGNPIITETNTLQMEEGEHYRPSPMFPSVDTWLVPRPGTDVEVPDDTRKVVRDRMLGILFSQSFDIIDRGVGTREDLNFGCQIALGFRKGPLDIMRDLGEGEVNRIMTRFIEDRPGFAGAKEPFSFYQDFSRYLLVDDVEGVKVITIRRPQAMNAISDELNNEILTVLKKYSDDPSVKGFVITGYGMSAFSAGADIGKFPETLGDKEKAAQYARDCADVQLYMDRMDKPIVAAVNGMALGGGLEIAIRCHGIIAEKKAIFRFPEVTLGISPGIGGCIVPYRKWPLGSGLFHEMICLGRPLTAREAKDVGMVQELAEDYPGLIEKAVDAVKRIGKEIPRIPEDPVDIPEIVVPEKPMAGKMALSKQAVSIIAETIRKGAMAVGLAEALEIGYRGAGEIACTDAAREGISAFLEKRKPEFTK